MDGAAFMPCVIRSLGADAAAEATAASRVSHVMRGGLATGLWGAVPLKGHALGADYRMSAQTASLKQLVARLRQMNKASRSAIR